MKASGGLRVIVTGLIAQYPLGGVAWDYIQHLLGLARLGHDVYYIEDTGQSPYVPHLNRLAAEPTYTVNYLSNLMARFGLQDRWAYRFPYPVVEWFGLSDAKRSELLKSADLLINVSGTLARLEDYASVGRLAYIDTDPTFTQVKLARGQRDFEEVVRMHDVHFTFGEALPGDTPQTDFDWQPTRQPIVQSEWASGETCRDTFTTIMNWTSYNPIEYEGVTYGQKNVEFERFLDLPSKVAPQRLEIAVNSGRTKKAPLELLAHRGWEVVDPSVVCADLDAYRQYVVTSKAEWSVAKNGYVVGQCGWFSCRSACYLAAGRPVVVQDTGFTSVLPTGRGILAFTTMDEAKDAIESVNESYESHARAGLDISREYFDSDKVLMDLLARALP